MGIDNTALDIILQSIRYRQPHHSRLLTLGRQGIHIPFTLVDAGLQRIGISPDSTYYQPYCEALFRHLGYTTVDSIDNSSYEDATIVHNMNLPISDEYKGKYEYIYDGGTTEHIFNTPQAL